MPSQEWCPHFSSLERLKEGTQWHQDPERRLGAVEALRRVQTILANRHLIVQGKKAYMSLLNHAMQGPFESLLKFYVTQLLGIDQVRRSELNLLWPEVVSPKAATAAVADLLRNRMFYVFPCLFNQLALDWLRVNNMSGEDLPTDTATTTTAMVLQ